MSLQYIRDTYQVPAKRGGQIIYDGLKCTILGARGHQLRVRLPKQKRTALLHPTWRVTYLDEQPNAKEAQQP